jgi:hypothetical protein
MGAGGRSGPQKSLFERKGEFFGEALSHETFDDNRVSVADQVHRFAL